MFDYVNDPRYWAAVKMIREKTRKGDTLEDTFRIICTNRYCRPVGYWSIYDLMTEKHLSFERAERLYYRHRERLFEIFVTPRSAIYGGM